MKAELFKRAIISDHDSQDQRNQQPGFVPFDGPVSRFGSPAKRRGVSIASDSLTTRVIPVQYLPSFQFTDTVCSPMSRGHPHGQACRERHGVCLTPSPRTQSAHSGYVQMNAPEISTQQRCCPQRKDCVRKARAEQINGLRTTWREHTEQSCHSYYGSLHSSACKICEK